MKTRALAPLTVSLGTVALALTVAFGAEPATRPIERARPGQWILEKETNVVGAGVDTRYHTTWVDRVEARRIILQRQDVTADRKLGVSAAVEAVVDLDQKAEASASDDNRATLATDETIVIDGKTLKCKKIETIVVDPTNGKRTTTRWTSTEVPLFGVVKTVVLDSAGREVSTTELVAWGETGGAELPLRQKP